MDPELQALEQDPNEQAGFDDDELPPTERPDAVEREPEKRAEVAAPAIEYAQLTKAEYEDLKAFRASQEKSFGTAFGKIGGIERTLQQIQAGAQVEISQEDIDALREDFPPLAAVLEKVRNMRALPGGSADSAQIDEMVQQRIAPALSAVEQKFELRLLARDHPDYKAVDANPAFAQWVATQSDEFRQSLAKASQEYDSAVVSAAMSSFKSASKAAPPVQNNPTRNSRMTAAVTPRGSGAARAPVGNDERAGFDDA